MLSIEESKQFFLAVWRVEEESSKNVNLFVRV